MVSELQEALDRDGVTCEARWIGLDEGPMDRWECVIVAGERRETLDFFTGLGLRRPARGVKTEWRGCQPYFWREPWGDAVVGFEAAAKAGLTVPVPPTSADVVYGALLDASALDQSFEDWCEEFGYDSDSRKALDLYLKCQEVGRKVRRLLGDRYDGLEH